MTTKMKTEFLKYMWQVTVTGFTEKCYIRQALCHKMASYACHLEPPAQQFVHRRKSHGHSNQYNTAVYSYSALLECFNVHINCTHVCRIYHM